MTDELTRAIAEAIHCERVDEPKSEPDPYCMEHGEPWPCPEPSRVSAALAPLTEARVREALRSARSEELDDVAAEFERSANRVERAKGETERTRYAHEVVEVLRNRAQEIRRG